MPKRRIGAFIEFYASLYTKSIFLPTVLSLVVTQPSLFGETEGSAAANVKSC